MRLAMMFLMLALLSVGCGQSSQPSQTSQTPPPAASPSPAVSVAYAPGSIKKGGEAVCVVCFSKEGKAELETVAETLDYKGKTYAFCNESEKAEFISNPGKYAGQ